MHFGSPYYRWAQALLCSTILSIPFPAHAEQPDEVQLDPIVVRSDLSGFEDLISSEKGTGTTSMNREQIEMRTGGSADINEVLKTLPNVQWQDHTNDDTGTSNFREQDLRPVEISISGARPDDNNFMLDGIEINTAGRGQENNGGTLEDQYMPDFDGLYNLHSQSIFVPSSIIESVEVQTHDISAEHGRFQGGVVRQTTMTPSASEWTGGVEVNGTASSWTRYKVATESGENTYGIAKPNAEKMDAAAYLSGPLAPDISVLSSFAYRHAGTSGPRDPQFVDDKLIETSTDQYTGLFKVQMDKDWGVLTLQSTNTLYANETDLRRSKMKPTYGDGIGSTNQVNFEREFGNLGLFKNTSVTADAYYTYSRQGRRDDGDGISIHRYKSFSYLDTSMSSQTYVSPGVEDCRDLGNNSTVWCMTGSTGDLLQYEHQYGAKAKVAADLWGNALRGGVGVKQTRASRRRDTDSQNYSSPKFYAPDMNDLFYSYFKASGPFECASSGDPYCYDDDQFAQHLGMRRAFDTTVDVTNIDGWLEYQIDLDRWKLTPGARLDYDDYFNNLNISPRLHASVRVLPDVTLSAGYARYYADNNLVYALADAMPDFVMYKRDIVDGKVYDEFSDRGWTEHSTSGRSNYTASDLSTPYNDEFSAGLSAVEPLLGGNIRLTYLHRKGRDQFTRSKEDGYGEYTLSNDGTSQYQSVSIEYAKLWSGLDFGPMNSFGLSAAATWSEQERTSSYGPEDYFDEGNLDPNDRGAYYKGRFYEPWEFNEVTGNLDIPIRGNVTMQSRFLDDDLTIWSRANFSLGYEGVRTAQENGSDKRIPHPDTGKEYNVKEDYFYRPVVTVDAGLTYKLPETQYGQAIVEARVNNLLGELGNGSAGNFQPYKKTQSFWLGLKATF
ncbi:TonB-dependent receptor plug domain-containing protein [Pseudovibrio exalbescens]|uniref:TonB-dependent receptor plug domain-containing protein n=1 Tax=Pseudovibrio exalbescens TaxID=197461 RepID=UPI000C9C79A4|nr:TonB-dependent receptor plug domain-containing protein [Pseudovibrio exalbescens]